MTFKTPEEVRLNAGLEPFQLAERSGVSVSTISRLERGVCKKLHALTLEKVGLALVESLRDRGVEYSLAAFIGIAIQRRDERLTRKRRKAS